MKFGELSAGVCFRIVPDDGKRYIKLSLPLNNGPTWNAKNESGVYNFSENQQVEILNNFKRDSDARSV
jgi:hypothetical protein